MKPFCRSPSRLLSSRGAFIALALYGVAWFTIEGGNIGWDGWGQLASIAMTMLVLREGRIRDLARDAKEDELIRAMPGARDELIRAEDREEAELEALRDPDN